MGFTISLAFPIRESRSLKLVSKVSVLWDSSKLNAFNIRSERAVRNGISHDYITQDVFVKRAKIHTDARRRCGDLSSRLASSNGCRWCRVMIIVSRLKHRHRRHPSKVKTRKPPIEKKRRNEPSPCPTLCLPTPFSKAYKTPCRLLF